MSSLTYKYHISVMPGPDEMPMGLQSGSGSGATSSGSIESSSGSSGCDGMGVEQDCTITLSASGGNADPNTGSIEIPISAAGSAPTAGDCCDLNEPDYSFSVIEVLSSISAEGPRESADSSLSILPDAASPQQALLQGTLNKGGRFYQIRLSASATWSAEESDNDCENCSGCDSCTAETESTVIAYRPCPSGCDKTVTVTPKLNPIYRWVVDDNEGTVTLKVRVDLNYINPDRTTPENAWTPTSTQAFESTFAQTIEDAWRSDYTIRSEKHECCPVKEYQPKLKIELTEDDNAYQIIVVSGTTPFNVIIDGNQDVIYNTTGPSIFDNKSQTYKCPSGNYNVVGNALLLQDSCDLLAKQSFTQGSPCYQKKQRPAAHEFGHMIGLTHPGGDNNSPAAYEADANALMGCGSELRIEYFEKWKEILDEHRVNCCGTFAIIEK